MSNILTIEIQFFSFWHCGSGASGGSEVDALVAKDNKLPYIPGKTLKGLIREACELLEQEDQVKQEDIDKCFGKRAKKDQENLDRKEAECYFSNATLTQKIESGLEEYLYETIAYTKIDDKSGVAENKSLREIEVVVPLSLQATIECADESCITLIKKAIGYVKQAGVGRNRGLGRCIIKVAKEQQGVQNG